MTTSHPHSSEKEREAAKQLLGRIQGKPSIKGDFVQFTYYSPYSPDETVDQIIALLALSHQSAEAALLEKLQPLLVDVPDIAGEYTDNIESMGLPLQAIQFQNQLRAKIRTALKPPKEEDV